MPSTRESAIVMLADSVEAAMKSTGINTIEEAEKLIRRIIKTKNDQDQLVQSGLSFRDVELIIQAFLQVYTRAISMKGSNTPMIIQFVNRQSKLATKAWQSLIRLILPAAMPVFANAAVDPAQPQWQSHSQGSKKPAEPSVTVIFAGTDRHAQDQS